MNSNNRTLAFQVSEEFFQRVKDYLAKHPKLKQREFVVGLIEQELTRFESQEAQSEHADSVTAPDDTTDKSTSGNDVDEHTAPEDSPNSGEAAE